MLIKPDVTGVRVFESASPLARFVTVAESDLSEGVIVSSAADPLAIPIIVLSGSLGEIPSAALLDHSSAPLLDNSSAYVEDHSG